MVSDKSKITSGFCPKSPSGQHCPHPYQGNWWSVAPAPITCCHCGKNIRNEHHGPFMERALEPEAEEVRRG